MTKTLGARQRHAVDRAFSRDAGGSVVRVVRRAWVRR
jgi:hypothetical protein